MKDLKLSDDQLNQLVDKVCEKFIKSELGENLKEAIDRKLNEKLAYAIFTLIEDDISKYGSLASYITNDESFRNLISDIFMKIINEERLVYLSSNNYRDTIPNLMNSLSINIRNLKTDVAILSDRLNLIDSELYTKITDIENELSNQRSS